MSGEGLAPNDPTPQGTSDVHMHVTAPSGHPLLQEALRAKVLKAALQAQAANNLHRVEAPAPNAAAPAPIPAAGSLPAFLGGGCIVPALRPRGDVDIYVARDIHHAERIGKYLCEAAETVEGFVKSVRRPTPTTRVTFPGESTMGVRAARILISRETLEAIYADHRKADWWQIACLTRLSPTGQVIDL